MTTVTINTNLALPVGLMHLIIDGRTRRGWVETALASHPPHPASLRCYLSTYMAFWEGMRPRVGHVTRARERGRQECLGFRLASHRDRPADIRAAGFVWPRVLILDLDET